MSLAANGKRNTTSCEEDEKAAHMKAVNKKLGVMQEHGSGSAGQQASGENCNKNTPRPFGLLACFIRKTWC
jgi:hypothetical protein